MAKMYLGEIPIQSLNIHHFEENTNDATMVASDLQAGVTAYARGQKITGTGKAFEHANYGVFVTNSPIIVSGNINVVEVASLEYPIRHTIALSEMKNIDFNTSQSVASVVINSVEYPIVAVVSGGILTFQCERDIDIEVFYGKDNYA